MQWQFDFGGLEGMARGSRGHVLGQHMSFTIVSFGGLCLGSLAMAICFWTNFNWPFIGEAAGFDWQFRLVWIVFSFGRHNKGLQAFHRVFANQGIAGRQSHTISLCLADEHPIERIFVKSGQAW